MSDLRTLGSFPGLQIVATQDNHELVTDPASFKAGSFSLQWHGGPTIASPKLFLVWCGTPSYDRARFEQFAADLMQDGYLDKMTFSGYKPGTAQYLGSANGPTFAAGTTVLDSAIRGELIQWLHASPTVPQPDGSTIYMVMMPPGVTVQFDQNSEQSCTAFCGFHEAAGYNQPVGDLLYTVQIDTGSECAGCNNGDPFASACMVASHEVNETQSDPLGNAWYETSTGKETGDEVAWIPLQYGPWTVQGYGSPDGQNLVGAYVQQQKPPTWQPDATIQADIGACASAYADALTKYTTGDVAGAAADLARFGGDGNSGGKPVMGGYAFELGVFLQGLTTAKPAAPR